MSEGTFWRTISISIISAALCCGVARAQESSTPTQQQDPNNPVSQNSDSSAPKEGASQDSQSADNDIKTPLPVAPSLEVHPVGSSISLPQYDTLLRWGPVYVRTLEFSQSYDQISGAPTAGQGIFNQGSFDTSILRASIVYDRVIGQNRLELEYDPRLTIVNGVVGKDYLNQSANLNYVQTLSPRWTLGLSNSVAYYSVRQLYGDYFLPVNTIAPGALPSSFLDSGGSWLNTNSQVSLAYALSPTSTLTISPNFSYSYVTGTTSGGGSGNVYQYGAQLNWTKQLTAHRSINAAYYYRAVESAGSSVPYQSIQVGITQDLGPSTVIGGSIGLLSSGFPSNQDNTVAGSVQLSRKLGRAVGSIGYYRGMPLFSELASQGVSQYVQGSYQVNLSQRWYLSVQGGYENSLTSNIINVSGKFGSAEVGYRLTPQISSYFSYTYKTQGGTDALLLSGTRKSYVAGLRWTARAAQ